MVTIILVIIIEIMTIITKIVIINLHHLKIAVVKANDSKEVFNKLLSILIQT